MLHHAANINLYRSMNKFSRRQIDDIFLILPENMICHFMWIVRQFAWNVKPFFFWKKQEKKIENYFNTSFAEKFTQTAKR